MRIKSKLALGLGFLFTVILTLGSLGLWFINQLSNDANAILRHNYAALTYANNMLKAMDNSQISLVYFSDFEPNLLLQEANAHEIGERALTDSIRKDFAALKKKDYQDSQLQLRIRQKLYDVVSLNLQAIERKHLALNQTAGNANLWIAGIFTACVLISFSFIFNFPDYIASPLRELTDGLKEIAKRNYETRLTFKTRDEFGELAKAFNRMTEKLYEYEHTNLAQLLTEKKRVEALIGNMHEPIIGLDQDLNVLFVNAEAEKLLSVTAQEIGGKYAPDIALQNDLLRQLIKDLPFFTQAANQVAEEEICLHIRGKDLYYAKELLHVALHAAGEEEARNMGHMIVLKNITRFKEADAAKIHFMEAISRELQAPVAAIGVLLSSNTAPDQRLQALREHVSRIEKVMSDMWEITRLTARV